MNKLRTVSAILLLPAYAAISIASPAIGVASGFESITVNKAPVRGNATLFEGSSFAAGRDGAHFNLNGGTSVRLGSLSAGSIFRDRLELNSGAAEVHTSGSYSIDALSLHVRNGARPAVARILVSQNHIRVGALSGSLQVLNGSGLLVATVAEGSATDFSPAGEASAGSGSVDGSGAGSAGANGSGAGTGAGSGAGSGVAGATGAGVAATHTALIVGGIVVASAGLATGLTVAAVTGSNETLSPSAR